MPQRPHALKMSLAISFFLVGIGLSALFADATDALFAAISVGSLDGAKSAVAKGAKIEAQARPADRGTMMSALHYAVTKGNAQMVAYLLARKADPNAHDSMGWSVIDSAVEAGSLDVLRQLVEAGARLTPATTAAPRSALHTAASWNRPALARYLVSKGMGVSTFGPSNTPLDIAIDAGYGPVAAVLAPLVGKNPSSGRGLDAYRAAFEKKYQAADLHWYAFIGDLSGVTRAVKTEGVGVGIATSDGRTPLHFASTVDVARFLLANGADPLTPDVTGDTPLHSALAIEALDVARLVLSAAPPGSFATTAGGRLFATTDRDMATLIRQKGGLCVFSTPLYSMGIEENILHEQESLAAVIGTDLHHILAISSLDNTNQVRYIVNGVMVGVYQKIQATTSLCMALDGTGTKWGVPLKDAKDGKDYVLREDGSRLGPFVRLRGFALSPDGKRSLIVSSATTDGTDMTITVKDLGRAAQSTTLTGVASDGVPSIGFSDNSVSWYALVEKAEHEQSALVNGKEVATDASQFWISPDGGAWAAATGAWGEQSIVVSDGTKLGPYQLVSGLAWAPGSKSWVAVVSDSAKGATIITSDQDSFGPMTDLEQSYNWVVRYASNGKSWLVTNRRRVFTNGALVDKTRTAADWIDAIVYAADGKSFIVVGTDSGNPASGEDVLFTSAGAAFSGIEPVALAAVTVKEKATAVRALAWFSSINKVVSLNSLAIDTVK